MARNLLQPALPTDRVGRYPKHKFNVSALPFQLRPFMIAPVLPGETMQTLYMESRCVTDPIINPLIGWKKEYFFFYVKMTDLVALDPDYVFFKNMFIDPTNADIAGAHGAVGNVPTSYTAKGGVDYVSYSLTSIVKHYFRDETEESWGTMIGSLPAAQFRDLGGLDSLTDESQMPEGDEIADATDAGDLDRLMDAYEMLRAMGLAQMSYEDFLRSNGVTVADVTEGKPELLWHVADWQYPSNTIDPLTGTPSSAVSWVFKQSSRGKPRFFKEPGFIIGITLTRPKIYMAGQYGNLASHMTRAWDWLPALAQAIDPATRLKNFPAGTGPLGDRSGSGAGIESEYWLDMADLLVHGDQFLDGQTDNAVAAIPARHMASIPSWSGGEDVLNKKYLSETFVKSLFKTPASAFNVREDGMVSLSIKGKVVDITQNANFVAGL